MKGGLTVCLGAAALVAALAGAANAQQLSYQFISPTFGGSSFNSDQLMAIATAQKPKEKTATTTTPTLTQGEQFAQQIQSQLLAALSSSLVQAITGSTAGSSGTFTVGDQTITYSRDLTQITVTIKDNTTGETTNISVPVLNTSSTSQGLSSALSAQSLTGGSVLDGSSLTSSLTTPLTGGSLTSESLLSSQSLIQ